MDGLRGIMQSEISQTERDKYGMISLICGIFKNKINEQSKEKQTHRHREQTDGCQMEGGLGGKNGDVIKKYKLPVTE